MPTLELTTICTLLLLKVFLFYAMCNPFKFEATNINNKRLFGEIESFKEYFMIGS